MSKWSAALAAAAVLLALPAQAAEGEFTSEKQCVVGADVTDRKGKTGKIESVGGGFCKLRYPDGSTALHLFWMLRAAGSDPKPHLKLGKIPAGRYACDWMGVELHILGPDAYRDGKGTRGTYRLNPDGTMVFIDGSFAPYPYAPGITGAWLREHRIGLSVGNHSVYSIMCDRK